MNPTETVEEYYESLRRGDPLAPYFAERADAVKFGVSERLAGYEAIADGLAEQTRTTDDWRVESRRLRVTAGSEVARFTDDVGLAWTDSTGTRRSFDTRWSGVLERVDRVGGGDGVRRENSGGDSDGGSGGGDGDGEDRNGVESSPDADWRFVQMHVSAPHDW